METFVLMSYAGPQQSFFDGSLLSTFPQNEGVLDLPFLLYLC